MYVFNRVKPDGFVSLADCGIRAIRCAYANDFNDVLRLLCKTQTGLRVLHGHVKKPLEIVVLICTFIVKSNQN